MIRVMVVDDHALFRRGLVRVLEDEGFVLAAEAASGEEALERIEDHPVDVVLLDLHMPGMGGVEATRRLAGQARVLVLTVSDADDDLFAAIRAGAAGYLTKSVEPQLLAQAIRQVAAGKAVLDPEVTAKALEAIRQHPRPNLPQLSRREREVLSLIAKGYANRAIAEALGISEHTVKTYIQRLYEKLGVATRAEAAALAAEYRIR